MLTACFALGQLSGPLLAALSNHYSASLQPALVLAATGLAMAGVLVITGNRSLQGCPSRTRMA
jgi:hypothetical protein